MPIGPDYGETPISDEDAQALTPTAREVLGADSGKVDVYDLEQVAQDAVSDRLVRSVLDGELAVADLVSPHFLRELHVELYGDIWPWAGRPRQLESSIGIDPNQVAVEVIDYWGASRRSGRRRCGFGGARVRLPRLGMRTAPYMPCIVGGRLAVAVLSSQPSAGLRSRPPGPLLPRPAATRTTRVG